MSRSRVYFTDCVIRDTDGINVLVTGDVDLVANRTQITGGRFGNVVIDNPRHGAHDVVHALFNRVEAGAGEEDIRQEFADNLKKSGIDIDVWLGRCGNVAAMASALMQQFGS